MLERHLQVLQCRGAIATDWLASLLLLFKQFDVNIRKIDLLPSLGLNGFFFNDDLELRIEFEQKDFQDSSLFKSTLQKHLKLLDAEFSFN